MPKRAVAAADEGLPNDDQLPVLVDTDRGLSVSRLKSAKALRPSMFAGEELDRFLAQLDEYVSIDQKEEFCRNTLPRAVGCTEEIRGLNREAKRLRRFMIKPLRTIREAKSKSLEDILFKALVSEIIDQHEHYWPSSIAHSIANDLISADCQWRAA